MVTFVLFFFFLLSLFFLPLSLSFSSSRFFFRRHSFLIGLHDVSNKNITASISIIISSAFSLFFLTA